MILHESRQEAESKTRNYAKQTGQSSHAMRDQAQQDGAPSQARPHTSSGKCQTKLNERAKRAKHDRKTKQSKIRRRCNEDKKPSQTRRPTKLSSPIRKLGEAGEEPNPARMETRPNQTRQPKQGARKPRNVKQQTKPSKTWNQSKVGHRVSKDLGRALGYDRGGCFLGVLGWSAQRWLLCAGRAANTNALHAAWTGTLGVGDGFAFRGVGASFWLNRFGGVSRPGRASVRQQVHLS